MCRCGGRCVDRLYASLERDTPLLLSLLYCVATAVATTTTHDRGPAPPGVVGEGKARRAIIIFGSLLWAADLPGQIGEEAGI